MQLGLFGAAEEAYRRLLAEDPGAPNVQLNLALAVLMQGRREEAVGLYRAFADGPGREDYPDLAARAELAVDLIEMQIERDGPESLAGAAGRAFQAKPGMRVRRWMARAARERRATMAK